VIKLLLILKNRKRRNKNITDFVENDLDRFLSRNGFLILSYEVREVE